MIIDLHTRIWANFEQFGRGVAARLRERRMEQWGQLDGSPTAHEHAMGCVDAACVFAYCSRLTGAGVPNEYIAEFCGRDPRRRYGVGAVDPMSLSAEEDLEKIASLGLVGVTVSPATQGFHPSHSRAMRLYERCAELGMPVFFTNGVPLPPEAMMEFGRPVLIDEVARNLPELKIVVGDFGSPWVDEAIALVGKHPNVWAELSGVASRPWALYHALLNAAGAGVMNKILFGSGFPLGSPAKAIETLYSINVFSHGTQLPAIPRSQIRGIVERDSLACLGIEHEVDDAPRPDDAALPEEELVTAHPLNGKRSNRAGGTEECEE